MDPGDDEPGADDPAALLYEEAAAAFVRDRLGGPVPSNADLIRLGRSRGLRLHRFKRASVLPRVRRVLGALRGFAPASLVDLGSGRGTFLWPLLAELPAVAVRAVERDAVRADLLAAVSRGGVARLGVIRGDAGALGLATASADAVTVLEVLEHVDDPARVAREAFRVARSVVIASVPSVPDDNPEHVRLFDRKGLERLLRDAGARRVSIDYVPGHAIAVAVK